MTWLRLSSAVLCSLLLVSLPAFCQQIAAPAPDPQLLLQKSLAVMTGNTSLTDITLSGTARRVAGSDDETGTVTLKASASGGMRVDFSYPSGSRSQIRTADADGPAGQWSGPDGAAHSIAYHNLVNDAGLAPAVTLARLLSTPNTLVTFVGQETRDGQSVVHLKTAERFSAKQPSTTKLLQHLSEMDIFLDSSTLLPIAIDFDTHPNDNALLNIPIEIRFSDYRAVSGAQIPFHVQKYLNNGLVLDLKFESAALNSGIAPETFQVEAGL